MYSEHTKNIFTDNTIITHRMCRKECGMCKARQDCPKMVTVSQRRVIQAHSQYATSGALNLSVGTCVGTCIVASVMTLQMDTYASTYMLFTFMSILLLLLLLLLM